MKAVKSDAGPSVLIVHVEFVFANEVPKFGAIAVSVEVVLRLNELRYIPSNLGSAQWLSNEQIFGLTRF